MRGINREGTRSAKETRREDIVRAWLLDRMGDGIRALRLAEIDDPTPAAGEAIVRVLLAGLNPADRYLAENQYPAKPQFPHILGRDAVAIVEQIGPDVRDLKPGDKVIILRSEIGVNRRGTF